MSLGNEILVSAFHAQGISSYEQAERINEIANRAGRQTVVDRAVIAGSQAFEALLLGYDPAEQAEGVFRECQDISLDVLCDSVDYGTNHRSRLGIPAELAVHGLLWWGIANKSGFGRYARFTTHAEDSSDEPGRKNGFDLLLRTEKRRHKVQVKKGALAIQKTLRYSDDVIVVTPQLLLADPDATELELHEAIVLENRDVLHSAITHLTRELHTQKAPSGRRKII
jgi:hypothetical protein